MRSDTPIGPFARTALCALILIAVSGTTVSAQAQDHRFTDEQIAEIEKRIQATRARLNLTPEQKQALAPILMSSFEKRFAVLQSYGFSGGARPGLSFRQKLALRNELNAIRQQTEKQLAAFLSDRQLAEYRKIQDENRERLRARLRN